MTKADTEYLCIQVTDHLCIKVIENKPIGNYKAVEHRYNVYVPFDFWVPEGTNLLYWKSGFQVYTLALDSIAEITDKAGGRLYKRTDQQPPITKDELFQIRERSI